MQSHGVFVRKASPAIPRNRLRLSSSLMGLRANSRNSRQTQVSLRRCRRRCQWLKLSNCHTARRGSQHFIAALLGSAFPVLRGNGNTTDNVGIKSMQNPADASLTYNGISVTRSTNSIDDVITGVTLSLNSTHTGGATTSINVVSDRSTLKTKLQDLVTTYNDVQFALNELSDPDSDEEEVGGALARDLAVIRTVRDTVYQAVTQDSSTPSGDITGLRDIGVTLTGYGELEFSETAYDSKAAASFEDISTMLSAGTNNQSRYDGQSQGLAIDAIAKLEVLTDSIDGIFAQRTESTRKELSTYSKELIDLEARMEALYEYLSQFTVMELLVKQLNSTRESLTDTWSNMGNFNK